MGTIRTEVREQHLDQFPAEESFLKAFLPCFFVTWGRVRRAYNTDLSVYFLNPEPFMSEAYGFDQEIMLVYSKYPTLEQRAIQAAESFLSDYPAKGRVERLTYYFVSEDADADAFFSTYATKNPESRLIIPLVAQELRDNSTDPWFIRNKTSMLLYGRDLFDFKLPLEKDTYFFGRNDLVVNLFDAIKRCENRGIFGLRKTGKTSLLFKLERMLKEGNVAEVLYIDCKLPANRKLRWYELLHYICSELSKRLGIVFECECAEMAVSRGFVSLVENLTKPILLVFDEIEYISPVAVDDTHWHKDFIDFWQTFWGCQSRHRTISALIAGVNPHVVELDSVGGIQNPLFGIVSYQFLTGLTLDETRNMIRTLGKRMGLKFDNQATEYLQSRYGGHPLLTRMACTATDTFIKQAREERPVSISVGRLKCEEEKRDAELTFYCRHVVSELRQFYSDEYEMLELLASGQVHDFIELAAYPEFTKHLRSYGLLGEDSYKRPIVAIPVIGRYVGLELARREGRQTVLKIVARDQRVEWLAKRLKAIILDLRLLEKVVKQAGTPLLFGPNSFPQADAFAGLAVVDTAEGFKNFVDTCNKCFVEPIENFGMSLGDKRYFWEDIKTNYPGLWDSLQRIKIYRHENAHLTLTSQATSELLRYLQQDLEGRNPSSVPELHFILQQCTLDAFLTGIQIELNTLT
ncbi:AAA-like domain-containing protein [Geomonas subterranea]|uniref:AAA-like domain-containing protein n=1 Tax=Geomonas subterranea TaxID=2847989 RepID=UPI001CD56988|nr:AAA-like domain-containing protein [Geomonas fuzhouensis]